MHKRQLRPHQQHNTNTRPPRKHFFLPRCVHVVAGSAVAAAREVVVLTSLVSILTAKVPCG
jgi:hypothetical protein